MDAVQCGLPIVIVGQRCQGFSKLNMPVQVLWRRQPLENGVLQQSQPFRVPEVLADFAVLVVDVVEIVQGHRRVHIAEHAAHGATAELGCVGINVKTLDQEVGGAMPVSCCDKFGFLFGGCHVRVAPSGDVFASMGEL